MGFKGATYLLIICTIYFLALPFRFVADSLKKRYDVIHCRHYLSLTPFSNHVRDELGLIAGHYYRLQTIPIIGKLQSAAGRSNQRTGLRADVARTSCGRFVFLQKNSIKRQLQHNALRIWHVCHIIFAMLCKSIFVF